MGCAPLGNLNGVPSLSLCTCRLSRPGPAPGARPERSGWCAHLQALPPRLATPPVLSLRLTVLWGPKENSPSKGDLDFSNPITRLASYDVGAETRGDSSPKKFEREARRKDKKAAQHARKPEGLRQGLGSVDEVQHSPPLPGGSTLPLPVTRATVLSP